MMRWLRRPVVEQRSLTPTYDREAERIVSAEILAQTQWLYEQHERRVQNAQNMAVAVLTVVGTIMALAPSLITDRPSPWELSALGLLAASGITTIVNCVRVLVPRMRTNGLPGVEALRKLAHQHEVLTAVRITVPVTQFAIDLLNPMNPDEPSPLSQAAADAERRTGILRYVYGWFTATFGLAVVISALFALVG